MKTKESKTMVIYMKFCQGTERNREISSWQCVYHYWSVWNYLENQFVSVVGLIFVRWPNILAYA